MHRNQSIAVFLISIAATSAIGVRPALAWTAKTELISPSSCQSASKRLVQCAISSRTLSGSVSESAVPLRTRVQTTVKGNCSTQYPLEVALTVAGEPAVRFFYLREPEITLRRRDGQAISKLQLSDSAKWTPYLSVADSCRIGLSIVANEPDVYSKAEAQAIVAKLEQQLRDKQSEVHWYEDLVQLRDAFVFLQRVAQSYHEELSDELVQELRADAEDAISSLGLLSSECGERLDPVDRDNILSLLLALPHLGRADDWRNSDGTPKTLADVMGPQAGAIYSTVDRLVRENSASAGTYETKLEQVAAEAAALTHKLALAKSQLATWLKG